VGSLHGNRLSLYQNTGNAYEDMKIVVNYFRKNCQGRMATKSLEGLSVLEGAGAVIP
jgi:hypothetical protein